MATLQRKSNIELFRIILMFMIVAHHCVIHSSIYTQSLPSNSIEAFVLAVLGCGGKIAINGFLLITGYFMCFSNISLRKFLKLFLEIEFYKISLYLLVVTTGLESFSVKEFFFSFLPVRNIVDNYVSCYLVLFLTIPYINVLISNISQKQHCYLLLLVFFIYSVLGSSPWSIVYMNYYSWFIVMYLMGAYIRKYPFNLNLKYYGLLFILSISLTIVSIYLCKSFIGKPYYFVVDCNKILALITSVFAFLFFVNINVPNSKIINICASTTFGIFLIHDNRISIKQYLWGSEYCSNDISFTLVSHALLSIIFVFFACSVIDYLRIILLEKPLFKYLDTRELFKGR